jgi:hypothetical protein
MNSTPQMPPMRVKNSISSLAVLALALAAGCTNPVLPPRDNPRDSLGVNYHNPGVELISGPSNDSIVHQSDITFRWRGTGKADSFDWMLDGRGWRGWTTQDTVRFPYLDEGYHNLLLRAKARYGIEQRTPLTCAFRVKTTPLPALAAVPWHFSASNGSEVYFNMIADSVSHLVEARLVLQYDPAALQYSYFACGGAWNYAGSVVHSDSSSPGQVDIRIRPNPPGQGISGTIAVAFISFRPLITQGTASISVAPASFLRNSSGDTIAFATRRGCVVDIGP